ncbi:CDP-diacylglycerol--glycerol-3-phosphate 3-phosphatidyltransferase [Clostridium acetireducens DSM 10703]|jgi:CDP-diacylglycerol--serine O-phosphatidyltransferase|uniref:CDP-diacylglycerol--serine O-phosphatidyltransferase n=1 Tax=Clostridium acetireducens DSM 10703 TaxID=1121290 RepID=A0A1E8EWS6_9CLOT|nr:CDP-diacylglycerol--serine O-phosphatidyltransferase [Clostridium acetireducens]OFI05085.1 CDP-diacylglycerol--glycerol-3-phosphate 3-phosphatidyltransferase [Clostridium acetireducens DSM 10703]
MAKAKQAIPNIFTLTNLSCGVISLLMTFQANYLLAAIFILLACLADRYDGRVARYLQVSSELGKELDSLADLVSFGVAPSLLMFNIYNYSNLGIIGYLLVLLLPIAGAYRLARYNSTEFDGIFKGVPITMSGAVLAVFSILTRNNPENFFVLSIILVFSFSYLMVSNIKLKKF